MTKKKDLDGKITFSSTLVSTWTPEYQKSSTTTTYPPDVESDVIIAGSTGGALKPGTQEYEFAWDTLEKGKWLRTQWKFTLKVLGLGELSIESKKEPSRKHEHV